MNTRRIVIISIIILLVFLLSFATYLLMTNKKPNVCQNLNCPESTLYVGSVNSDKYYVCDCRYSKIIKPENIICFSSDQEAVDNGYIKIDC